MQAAWKFFCDGEFRVIGIFAASWDVSVIVHRMNRYDEPQRGFGPLTAPETPELPRGETNGV